MSTIFRRLFPFVPTKRSYAIWPRTRRGAATIPPRWNFKNCWEFCLSDGSNREIDVRVGRSATPASRS